MSVFCLWVRDTKGKNCIRDACHGIITRNRLCDAHSIQGRDFISKLDSFENSVKSFEEIVVQPVDVTVFVFM